MAVYDLKKEKGSPLYYSLYEKIKDDIESGKIKGGEKLPSKRRLAEDLGISAVTVENAYYQLLAEGYIYSLERSGYYAEKDVKKKPVLNAPRIKKQTDETAPAGSEAERGGGFPFSVWARLMRETLLEGDSIQEQGNRRSGEKYNYRRGHGIYIFAFSAVFRRG